ncbi:hypothetical protein SCHPADRAFT_948238 [Schizopora paradoxa]|uniref:Uncharacterized protein n=1 Tax=Schizopora paradoxa TaxID=27342 RepID=A0A0H2QX08_9AGAM|nr:hypothetical protein SCHPADRAFT_948238 [Schizopora paradoxa]
MSNKRRSDGKDAEYYFGRIIATLEKDKLVSNWLLKKASKAWLASLCRQKGLEVGGKQNKDDCMDALRNWHEREIASRSPMHRFVGTDVAFQVPSGQPVTSHSTSSIREPTIIVYDKDERPSGKKQKVKEGTSNKSVPVLAVQARNQHPGPRFVSVRLYEKPKDWRHTQESLCLLESNGDLDLASLNNIFRLPLNVSCRVIHPKTRRPIFESKERGSRILEKVLVDEALDDSQHIRVVLMQNRTSSPSL